MNCCCSSSYGAISIISPPFVAMLRPHLQVSSHLLTMRMVIIEALQLALFLPLAREVSSKSFQVLETKILSISLRLA